MTTSAQATDPAAPPHTKTDPELSTHVNDVTLVGELAAPPQERELPSGDRVITFRISVRTEALTAAQRRPPDGRSRTDSIDCVTGTPALIKRVLSYSPGDLIEVHGSLRHRYWRGPGGLNSRYEVEAHTLRSRRHRRQ